VIDTHCHLADDVFAADLEAVIARAREAGVEGALVILEAGNEQEERQAERIAALWPEVRFSVGVHPHGASAYADDADKAAANVRAQIARIPLTRAVGEIGLDYHYDYSPRDVQIAVFRCQLRLARALDLPIVIHTREADADTLAILREQGGESWRGVLHCFSGTPDLARAGLDLGLHVSLAGIVTFNRAKELRDTAKGVPLHRLLAETDSPFLAPVPYRGKRNEPAWVAHVAAALAEVHRVPIEEIDRCTTANFRSLFRP
jgi:TatD DNase family protein